jgi:hypothetical protein
MIDIQVLFVHIIWLAGREGPVRVLCERSRTAGGAWGVLNGQQSVGGERVADSVPAASAISRASRDAMLVDDTRSHRSGASGAIQPGFQTAGEWLWGHVCAILESKHRDSTQNLHRYTLADHLKTDFRF